MDADRDRQDEAVAVAAAEDYESMTRCVVEGDINTTETWYIIGNVSRTTTALSGDGQDSASGFKFDFTFPQTLTYLRMGIYGEAEQMRLHGDDDSCWHKHSVIPTNRVHDRVRH